MYFLPSTSAEDVIGQPARAQFEAFLDEHRSDINHCLDGLTQEQARRSLVPSRTTLLGLVKHATVVEKVWFDEAITRRPRAEIGIPATPDESFILDDTDTIASIRQAHSQACESSRRATASLGLDSMVYGNRRGPLPLAGSTSTRCVNLPSTAATPTSSESRSSITSRARDRTVGRQLPFGHAADGTRPGGPRHALMHATAPRRTGCSASSNCAVPPR